MQVWTKVATCCLFKVCVFLKFAIAFHFANELVFYPESRVQCCTLWVEFRIDAQTEELLGHPLKTDRTRELFSSSESEVTCQMFTNRQ